MATNKALANIQICSTLKDKKMSCDVFAEQVEVGNIHGHLFNVLHKSHESPFFSSMLCRVKQDIDKERKHSHMMIRLRRRTRLLQAEHDAGTVMAPLAN